MFLVIIFLFIVFILLMSIVMIINPYLIWRITESWKSSTTPSKAYFIYQRIGGLIGVIFSLFFLLTFLKFL